MHRCREGGGGAEAGGDELGVWTKNPDKHGRYFIPKIKFSNYIFRLISRINHLEDL